VLTDAATTAALRGLYQATRVVPARLRYTATVREYERHQDAAD
jgi:hypothetical protein